MALASLDMSPDYVLSSLDQDISLVASVKRAYEHATVIDSSLAPLDIGTTWVILYFFISLVCGVFINPNLFSILLRYRDM